jgi:hypothetical protein
MRLIRFHHGTDLASAHQILAHGLDAAMAANYNSSGEFWATTDPIIADWFALTNPANGPPARLEFALPEQTVQDLLAQNPAVVHRHSPQTYEFLPASFGVVNQRMTNQQVVPVP